MLSLDGVLILVLAHLHTCHGEMSNVSSAESHVFYASVDSTIIPPCRQQCEIIVSGVQWESLWIAIHQIAIQYKLLNRLVFCSLVPPVDWIWVWRITRYCDRLANSGCLVLMILRRKFCKKRLFILPHTGRANKRDPKLMDIILSNLNRFTFFSLEDSLVICFKKVVIKIPPHLAYVATLFCETLMSENKRLTINYKVV